MTRFQRHCLRACADLGNNAYGVTMLDALGGTIGRIYVAMEALEEAGLVETFTGEPTPERGGRPKRYWLVNNAGKKALEEDQ